MENEKEGENVGTAKLFDRTKQWKEVGVRSGLESIGFYLGPPRGEGYVEIEPSRFNRKNGNSGEY